DFFLRRDTQAKEDLRHHEQDESGDAAIDDGGNDALDLHADLTPVSVDRTERCIGARNSGCRKDAGEHSADNAANRMNTEDVECIVIAERPLEARRGEVADHARSEADPESTHGIDEAGSRSDRDEAGDGTGR